LGYCCDFGEGDEYGYEMMEQMLVCINAGMNGSCFFGLLSVGMGQCRE